jgi:hypothetical protein
MSERRLTNQWGPWQRLIDSIGPHYRTQPLEARDRAKDELRDFNDEQLETIAVEGRTAARTLDEDGARLTVTMTEKRERHSRIAGDLQREAELLLRRRRWAMTPQRRRQARADAAERADRPEEHRRRAAQAHEQLRELGNRRRHLYPWFERHRDVLARGMAAELTLDAAHQAVYHVLGAPGIASLTAACLTSDRAIDIGQLQELVRNGGQARQRLLFKVAADLYGREQGVSLSEVLGELDGGDLDRVPCGIAVVKRSPIAIPGTPRRPLDTRRRTWPKRTRRREPIGPRRIGSPRAAPSATSDQTRSMPSRNRGGASSLERCI